MLDVLPLDHRDIFLLLRVSKNLRDKLVFTLSDNREFDTKIYLENRIARCNSRIWPSGIWRQILPPKITIFLWKLIQNAVPTDDRIRTRGVPLASRCHCCVRYHEESLKHLFIQSEVANSVWKFFGEIFLSPYTFCSIPNARALWMAKKKSVSRFEICKAAASAYIFKEIWNSRCHSLF